MTMIGNQAIFAIEYQLTGEYLGIEYAYFCFWSSNRRIGDFRSEIILSTSVDYMAAFLKHASQRNIATLDGKPKEDVFTYLYDRIIITTRPGQPLEEAMKSYKSIASDDIYDIEDLQERFHLDHVGSASFLDKVSIILMNDNILKLQRLIWRDLDSMCLYETLLPEEYFDEVSRQFLSEVKK